MLLNFFARYQTRTMAMFAVVLLLCATVASAAERITIPANKCGPMAALKAAGQPVNCLPFLEHKNGEKLEPSEYRTAPDKEFFLPAGCSPNAARTAEALQGELSQFGPPPANSACKGPGCDEKLIAANKKIGQLKGDLADSRGMIDSLNSQLADSKKKLAAAFDEFGGKISPLWLLLLLLLIPAFLLGRRNSNEAPQRIPTVVPGPGEDTQVAAARASQAHAESQLDEMIKERNSAVEDKTQAEEARDKAVDREQKMRDVFTDLKTQFDDLQARFEHLEAHYENLYNNPAALRARLTSLESAMEPVEVIHEPAPSPVAEEVVEPVHQG